MEGGKCGCAMRRAAVPREAVEERGGADEKKAKFSAFLIIFFFAAKKFFIRSVYNFRRELNM